MKVDPVPELVDDEDEVELDVLEVVDVAERRIRALEMTTTIMINIISISAALDRAHLFPSFIEDWEKCSKPDI